MPIMDKKNSEWFNEIEDTTVDEFDSFDDDIDWDALERELDISDDEYTDEELANIYGGDLTYCPNCGKRLAKDYGYSYCPNCEPKRVEDDTLVEAPVVKLSDDKLNNPSEVNFSKMIRDAEEKERAEKDEAERLARKDELSQKYSGVIYSIQKVNNTDEPGIEINRLEAAFEELVPNAGKADTVAGELVRATMRIIFRYYNDGDYFFMGYGLETAAPSAAYLSDRYEDIISEGMEIGQVFANEYGLKDKELDEKYEKFLKTLADVVVQDIIDNPELIEEENDVDSRDFDPEYIVDNQPRFETDFMVSQDVQDLYDAGIISNRDVQYYVEECFEWDRHYNGSEIYYDGGDYVYMSNLTYEGFSGILDRFKGYSAIEKFWEDFVADYADQLEEYRNAEDEEYEEEEPELDDEGEDYSESFHKKINSVKINQIGSRRIRESLSNRLATGDLDYNPEIDSLGAEENGVVIDIQDRESHTLEKRGPRRWASPRVTSHSWGRIWKDGECEQFTGSKNEVRSKMLKRLRDMDEDFSDSNSSYMLTTADEVLGGLINNLDDKQIDSTVTIVEKIARKLKAKSMSELYVLTIEDEYSPEWTMATREGKPQRAGGQNIQYWTIGGNLFAEVRVSGQAMLFFNNEDAAKDYISSVDEENLYEGLDRVESDLKSITNDFTMSTGTVKCYSEEEKNQGVKVLKKHYNKVTVSEDGKCYALTFANKIKGSINEGYHNNSEEYAPYFPEEYRLYDEQTANFFIQTTKVFLNGKDVGSIQKHPKRGGSRRNDSNRVTSTYYVAIPKNGNQKMVNTPEEAVKVILNKSETIKESAYNEDALRRFRDKQLNK